MFPFWLLEFLASLVVVIGALAVLLLLLTGLVFVCVGIVSQGELLVEFQRFVLYRRKELFERKKKMEE